MNALPRACNRAAPWPLFVLLLAMAGTVPLAAAQQSPCPVDYRRTLAAGTLVPERIVWRGRAIIAGATEAGLRQAIGAPPSTTQDWQPRTALDQCEFLLSLLRRHPDSMHLYRYGELRLREMAGEFRLLEWPLAGAGRVHAFLHRAGPGGDGRVYLLHFVPEPVAVEQVRRKPGRSQVFVRDGAVPIEWDIDTNRVVDAAR
jgi:hypothetical protein